MSSSDLQQTQGTTWQVPARVLRQRVRARWARAGLAIALVILVAAPLVVGDSYSIIEHTLSESGGQGVEAGWVLRSGMVLTALSVLALSIAAGGIWGRLPTWMLRLYAMGLIFGSIYSESPWHGGPHDGDEAFLHTVFIFSAAVAFVVGALALSASRSSRRVHTLDWAMAAVVVFIPQLMLLVDQDGLLQRLLVLAGYLWLIAEATRIIRVQEAGINARRS